MSRPSVFIPASAGQSRSTSSSVTKGATDFLKSNGAIAALLPTVHRMAALQKDCAAALPPVFEACNPIEFSEGRLTLSVPNAALSAKLRQQLPKLQESLCRAGWQVNAVRLKLQVTRSAPTVERRPAAVLPSTAIDAFEQLKNTLEQSPRNAPLTAALQSMLKKRRGG